MGAVPRTAAVLLTVAATVLWQPSALYPQQDEAAAANSVDAASDESPNEAEEQDKEGAGKSSASAEELLRRTMEIDIRTASTEELRSWCRRLDLVTKGTNQVLRQRLFEYYRQLFQEFSPEGRETTAERTDGEDGAGEELELGHADVMTAEGEEDQQVQLSGGVVVRMRDNRQNALHSIEAESLRYNGEAGLLTASGAVRYRMEQGGETQEFTGEALTFDIEDFYGIFLGGVTSETQEIEGEKVTFYFKGRSIYRSPQNRVFFNDGVITSDPRQEPYYSITADNFWLLAPNEWALSGGVLRLGRVPILYIPFLFKPGDELIFHPVFQYDQKEGYIVRTTTYLLGQPRQQTPGGLSFLQMEEEEQYAYERRGLFLQKTGKPRETEWVAESDSYAKLIADYYTRLGPVVGFDARLNGLSPLSTLQLHTGVGFTDYIFPLPGFSGAYIPYRVDEEKDRYVTEPQQPWLLGTQFPFRFGFDLSLDFDWQQGGLSLEAPLYSDPYFRGRLLDRQERMGVEQFTSPSWLESSTVEELFRDPVFKLHADYTPAIETPFSPWISSFSVRKLESRLRLSQETTLPKEESTATESPIGYYYPEVLTPLDTSLTAGGTLFSAALGGQEAALGASDSAGEESGERGEYPPPPEGLRPPEEEKEEQQEQQEQQEQEQQEQQEQEQQEQEQQEQQEQQERGERFPPLRPSEGTAVIESDVPFSHQLDYDLSSDLEYHRVYGDNTEAPPDEINFDPTYSFVSTSGSGDWTYRADVAGERVTVENVVGLGGTLRRHYREESNLDLSDYREQDRRASYFAVDNRLQVTGGLFPDSNGWSDSALLYRVNSDLYEMRYSSESGSYLPDFIRWEKEYLDTHETELALRYSSGDTRVQFIGTTSLPPLNFTSNLRLRASTSRADGRAALRVREADEGGAEYGPLELGGTLRFLEESRFSHTLFLLERKRDQRSISELELAFWDRSLRLFQSFEWNVDEMKPQHSISTLDLWWLSLNFDVRDAPGYSWDGTAWKQEQERFAAYQASAEVDYSYEPEPMWKGRVRLSAFADSSIRADLRRFTKSSLVFGAGFRGSIAEFLDFNFRVSSENTAVYRYVPSWAAALEVPWINPAEDLLKSFNFFDTQERVISNFNLNSITINMVHHMPDWDLRFDYNGSYEVNEAERKFEWNSSFTISLQWTPIPIVRREVSYEDGETTF